MCLRFATCVLCLLMVIAGFGCSPGGGDSAKTAPVLFSVPSSSLSLERNVHGTRYGEHTVAIYTYGPKDRGRAIVLLDYDTENGFAAGKARRLQIPASLPGLNPNYSVDSTGNYLFQTIPDRELLLLDPKGKLVEGFSDNVKQFVKENRDISPDKSIWTPMYGRFVWVRRSYGSTPDDPHTLLRLSEGGEVLDRLDIPSGKGFHLLGMFAEPDTICYANDGSLYSWKNQGGDSAPEPQDIPFPETGFRARRLPDGRWFTGSNQYCTLLDSKGWLLWSFKGEGGMFDYSNPEGADQRRIVENYMWPFMYASDGNVFVGMGMMPGGLNDGTYVPAVKMWEFPGSA